MEYGYTIHELPSITCVSIFWPSDSETNVEHNENGITSYNTEKWREWSEGGKQAQRMPEQFIIHTYM